MAGAGGILHPSLELQKEAYLRQEGSDLGSPPPSRLAPWGLAAHVRLGNSYSTCHHAKLWRTDHQHGCPLTNVTAAAGRVRRPPGEVSVARAALSPRPSFAAPSYPRSPPRPSPGGLHYSDEDICNKYNGAVLTESANLKEKSVDASESEVSGCRRHPLPL